MLVLVTASALVTRNLSMGLARSRWQNVLEIVVTSINEQIEEVGSAIRRSIWRLSAHFFCS